MSYSIRIQDTTGLWIVVDDDTGRALGRGELPQTAINFAIQNGMPSAERSILLESARIQEENARIRREAELSRPTASSGDVVGNASAARDDGANPQRPPVGQQVLLPNGRLDPPGAGASTNAVPTPTSESNPTTGTNAENRPLTNTQAENNQSNRSAAGGIPGAGSATLPESIPATGPDQPITNIGGPGAGARGDDGTQPSPSVVVNRLDALYAANNNYIPSKSNVLNNFNNYTYSLSWYLVDPNSYNTTVQTIKKNLNGYYLLAQSGGIGSPTGKTFFDNNSTTNTNAISGISRNKYFNLDYYIDNLVIETAYSSKIDSGGPAAFKNISFTVSEPNGLTLPWNLFRAVSEVYQNVRRTSDISGPINYASGFYCLVIRFYGYDQQGNLVQPITNNVSNTDPKAAVEKFIFYQQNSLSYSVSSKLTEYRITGSSPSTKIGFSTDRGSIPYNMQFTGSTVKDILVGQIQQQTPSQTAGDATRNGVPVRETPNTTPTADRNLPTSSADGASPNASVGVP